MPQNRGVIPIETTLPWLVPGSMVALAVSILASGVVGRWLGVRRSIAAVGLFSLGVILASTLSPLDRAEVIAPGLVRTCDLSRTWLASPSDLTQVNDVTLNILLFVPLGWALAIAPWSRRKLLLLVGAIALPVAIEAVQLQVSGLGRGCQAADVVDNLTGLTIGLVAGLIVAWLAPGMRRPLEGSL